MKGFDPIWCKLIEQFVRGGNVGIKVNDDIGHYFQTRKELRQGDPLSPMLFNIVADMLAILIARAKEDEQIGSLIPHLVEGGISILQYADDTILFLEHDTGKAVNMNRVKPILAFFPDGLFHGSYFIGILRFKHEQSEFPLGLTTHRFLDFIGPKGRLLGFSSHPGFPNIEQPN
jgi:hypothetical protein